MVAVSSGQVAYAVGTQWVATEQMAQQGVWVSDGQSDAHPLCSHEDGTVRFWDASGVALRPLYKLSTAGLFQTDCEHMDSLGQAAEDDWPPFRKVGPLP